jgi:hypothetical protein
MSGLLLFAGGLIIPAIAGAMGYSLWIIAIYAALFHLVARSSTFRSITRLPSAPDTSNVPVTAFLGGWIITLLPMIGAYGIGWLFAWLF